MGKLHLSFACGRYDRFRPIEDGRVSPEGVELTFIPLDPEELFWRQAQYGEFDVAEYSLSAYLIERGRNDDRHVGIPVFPSRAFRHSAIFVNTDKGIKGPENLKGKRVGLPDYTMTANLWIRGLWQDEYGVHPRDIHWMAGGLNEPGRRQRIKVDLPPDVKLEDIGNRTLSDMLAAGEIDALIGAREPDCFRNGSPKVARLWPNYVEIEQEYFRRTGIFPIMHLVVIKRELHERHPWLAQSLTKAFTEAKEMAQTELYTLSAPRIMLPWYIAQFEDTMELMGRDFWPYGVDANRKVLETAARYAFEQGLSENLVNVEDAFPASTLRPAKI